MNKETLENLSALMDGELSRETSLFVTRRLSTDEALGASWERYHLIRDCIRQPGSKQVVTGLQARISASLAADSAPVSRGLGGTRWLKPVSGLAIAASVAVMAIILVTQFNSLFQAFLILTAVVFSTGGVFLGLSAIGLRQAIPGSR